MSSTQLMDTNCMTLNRFILEEQQAFPLATGDLTNLLNSIGTAVKAISTAVRRAGMTNMFGISGDQNATGDSVQKLDVLSNELFINMLKSTFTCAGMVSEENEGIIEVETKSKGKYYVYFDPLDGSSNIDCLVSIGSIFGIARKTSEDLPKDILKAGNEYIVSGYTLYGSATMMVLTTGNGVNGFTLDPSIGEFLLTDRDMKIKPRGKIYSLNEGYTSQWSDPVRKYIESLKFPEGKKPAYGARYIGSMVADVHRTLKYGGIFMYPGTSSAPNGKLRILYECNPMSHIIVQAGGLAVTGNGNENMLDKVPTKLHDRSQIMLGSVEDVKDFLKFVNEDEEEKKKQTPAN